ncbi:DUF4129 domain-containing protein [Mycobacterium sp. CPCC 205372]|uniref:DUF4129 domain-containing protein n=1 Tax=Mycobacterium hippophais TaxID=3016340 RepID=A0ABT4PTD5_9MYCO|nr:DUF4129 domain-containing protein [Mycobacterium hippophais]MCZ8379837.1 DUF4129 domain-containing protein [Mycobacterium hippophais]
MPGDDKAVARTVAVIVLVMLATVALRGHLPGVERSETEAVDPEATTGGPGTLVAVIAMLAVSMAVIAIAIANQTRRPAAAAYPVEAPRDARGERGRLPWRLLAIVGAGLLLWLLVVLLLMRWGNQLAVDDVPVPSDAESAPPLDAPPAEPPEPPDGEDQPGGNVFGYLMAATIALFVLSFAATIVGRRKAGAVVSSPPSAVAPPEPAPAGPDLARAAELGLAEIGDHSRDPREAIIACYVAMERELEKSPGTIPQASDTPSEVLARAVRSRVLRADSATGLVDLFEEARFSPHEMGEQHRADAVRALRLVRDELEAAR